MAARIVAGSLWLDATAYDPSPGSPAFALDVTGARGTDCADVGAPEASIVEEFDASLAAVPGLNNGCRDLVVTGRASRDDGTKAGRPPFRFTLKFDGKAYPLGALRRAWEAWRS